MNYPVEKYVQLLKDLQEEMVNKIKEIDKINVNFLVPEAIERHLMIENYYTILAALERIENRTNFDLESIING